MTTRIHHTTHQIEISAAAETIYGLIADAPQWPVRFGPTVHVERTSSGGGEERLAIWALANSEVKHWTSRRDLDANRRRIRFRQERSSPPVAAMGGEWIVTPIPGGSQLTLRHDFAPVSEDPADVAWILSATDRNSETELANIKALAEGTAGRPDLTFGFADEVVVGGPAERVYEFLYAAARWPDRLPHVSRLELREDTPGIQVMTMDTKAEDGSVHTTESARVCFPHQRIVYKQIATPVLMTAHVGEWSLTGESAGTRVVSRHTITINEQGITGVLGADAGVPEARAFLRKAVGGNSRATLELAKSFAEAGDAR